MSRRRRSIVFTLAALAAAAAAATLAQRYGSTVALGYGPLRPVVVTREALPATAIDPRAAASRLAVRRVPARFVPPDALASPAEAVGLVARTTLAAGTYLSASLLRLPRDTKAAGRRGLRDGRSPVEVNVSGAGALLASGAPTSGTRVDVVVSGDPATGSGRTRIAASAVPLLALRPADEGVGPATAAATLALRRRQALKLIAAESAGRRLTLLPRR
jgi:Flp pilus assembly protein CpaB